MREYYDLHVPGLENYLAEGFINHNSAKTYGCCFKGLWLSDVFPKNRGLIYRQVGKDLRETTMKTLGKLLPRTRTETWSDQMGSIVLQNGSEILFTHMDNPDIENIIKGLEINWFFGDQAEDTAEEIFDKLRARLGRWDQAIVPEWMLQQEEAAGREWRWRHPVSGRPIPPTYAMIAVNPDSEVHWVYNRFHPESSEWQEKWSTLGYKMFFFSTRRNKFLPQQNLDELLKHDPEFVRRYVDGLWGIPEGVIHTIPPESIIEFDDPIAADRFIETLRRTCTLGRTLDHGDSAPTVCAWWAVDRNGNVIVYREYYQPNKLVSYHREQIHAMSRGESFTWNLADPSIFAKGTGGQKHGQFWSVADEWSDHRELPADTSVTWWPADNNEMGTRNRIGEYLRVDPERVHPVTGQKGAPHLYFVKRNEHYPQGCVNIIRETRAQQRKCMGTVGGKKLFTDERDESIVDHGYDCVSPDSRILRADLTWVEAASLRPGDILLAFDEARGTSGSGRKWRTSQVEHVSIVQKPSYRLIFDDGTKVVCSYDHQWLTDPASRVTAQTAASKRKWIRAEHLDGVNHRTSGRSRGLPCGQRRVLKPLPVWVSLTTREAGYLAGFFDGEGSVCSASLSASQRPNAALEAVSSALNVLGFQYGVYEHGGGPDVRSIQIHGGLSERLRFLGSIRPSRLLANASSPSTRFDVSESVAVIRAEFLGDVIELVSIQTTSRTFICEGLASHNCVRYTLASRPPIAREPSRKSGPNTFLGKQRLLKRVPQSVRP